MAGGEFQSKEAPGAVSVAVDGKRVVLSPEGIKSIEGTKAEVARKIVNALAARHAL